MSNMANIDSLLITSFMFSVCDVKYARPTGFVRPPCRHMNAAIVM